MHLGVWRCVQKHRREAGALRSTSIQGAKRTAGFRSNHEALERPPRHLELDFVIEEGEGVREVATQADLDGSTLDMAEKPTRFSSTFVRVIKMNSYVARVR